jgi:hypothetical protein
MTLHRRALAGLAAVTLAMPCIITAEVLVLRDGRRVDGTLVGVRGDSIEFEHRGGREDGRVRRYDRDEIRSIQFDEGNNPDRDRFDNRPRAGLRERTAMVDSRTAWTDTGVDVRGGQEVSFGASGQVRWGPNRRDGAAGERNSPANQARPMPNRNAAALIGKVGVNGDPFFIGEDQQPIRMRGAGRLFLGLNDDFLQDNSGSLRVTIGY